MKTKIKNLRIVLINLILIFVMIARMTPEVTHSVKGLFKESLQTPIIKTSTNPQSRLGFNIKVGEMKIVKDTIIDVFEEKQRQIELEKQAQEELQRQIEAVTVFASRSLNSYDISVYTDLSPMRKINVDQMNYIIDYWVSMSGNTTFAGYGQAFIDASKLSGLDPVYLLAHAGLESGWGGSQIARDKYNFFGIGAFDSNPYECSYVMGDSIYNGIIEGATWIARNYYEAGQTSLYTMRYNNGYNEYCSSNTWGYDITSIIQTSYSLI